eukprot:jgi/Chrzof1/4256/Cz14g05060.t1
MSLVLQQTSQGHARPFTQGQQRWRGQPGFTLTKGIPRAVQDIQRIDAHQDSAAHDMSTTLQLANVRSALIRQEDTIIFNLIERAQFARNQAVYVSDAIPVPGFNISGQRYSLLEYVLRETEQLHGKVRRYTSPDEHAFYPDEQPALVLPPLQYPSVLPPSAKAVNINDKIMEVYLQDVLPRITADGDDGNYGSAATLDVLCLQALSKRIHYGKWVAEAKFRAQPEQYSALIRAGDVAGIMDLLTDVSVEQKVVERVHVKAATFGQDIMSVENGTTQQGDAPKLKVQPSILAGIYDRWIMPLTKEVQVQYLLRRLDQL